MSVRKTIIWYFKTHKLKLFTIILMVVLVTVLALMPAQILRIIADDVIPKGNYEKLLKMAIIFAVTYAIIGLATFLKDIIMLGTALHITTDLKKNMMKHVEKISYKEIVKTDSGSLEAYFNNDVYAINELFTSGVVNMATDLFKIIGIVIAIFIYSYKFGLIVLGLLPILILFTSIIRRKMLKAQLKTKSLEGNANKDLLENVENIEQIKVNKAELYAEKKYNKILKNHFRANQASNLYDSFFSPVMQIIRNIVICGILLLSGYNANIFGMTIGMIISSISLITDLFNPIENLGMEIQTIQRSVAAIKRIDEFFKIEEDGNKEYHSFEDVSINYQDVSFAYEEKMIIEGFNLHIKQGEKIAFQGPSGSGKSTLMKLAMGLIKPVKGNVKINDVDTSILDGKTRKETFAIVYQDPFFSGGSIYEEISLLDEYITHEDVKRALEKVGLDYITNLDEELNENVYSSGEIALFNIARVIVRNPKIIFLDEMNAKIDPETSKKILRLINQMAENRIIISINHYGDTLENARVIQLS